MAKVDQEILSLITRVLQVNARAPWQMVGRSRADEISALRGELGALVLSPKKSSRQSPWVRDLALQLLQSDIRIPGMPMSPAAVEWTFERAEDKDGVIKLLTGDLDASDHLRTFYGDSKYWFLYGLEEVLGLAWQVMPNKDIVLEGWEDYRDTLVLPAGTSEIQLVGALETWDKYRSK